MKHTHRYVCADCGAAKQTVKRGLSQYAKQHATPYCYCLTCLPIRKQEAMDETMRMISSGFLSPTWQTDKHIMNSAPTVKLESIADIEARLSVCACGHPAKMHDEDAMGNLLFCCEIADPVGDNAPVCCECDHFRSVPKEAMAA